VVLAGYITPYLPFGVPVRVISVVLPGLLIIFLSIGAVSAGLTSLNAGVIALSRKLFSQARIRRIPGFDEE
jgi:amino acid transporter